MNKLLILLIIIVILYETNNFKIKKETKNINFMSNKNKIFSLVLKKTKHALDTLKIPFFLSSGTCLGYYRDNKFIEHDYDIDLGIFAKDYTENIIIEMKNNGLLLYRVLGTEEDGYELSFYMPTRKFKKMAKIDIFLHYNEIIDNKKYIYWKSYIYNDNSQPKFMNFQNDRNVEVKYRVPHFTLKKVKFMNIDVHVPNPTLTYIKHHYGETWNIPIKKDKYSFKSSPVSIVKNN
jgi:hypothetical protein